MTNRITDFFKLETAGAILLIIATILALVISNSFLYEHYKQFLITPISISIADFSLNKPILLWINDGLMAIFFCYIAIEIKNKIIINDRIGWSQLSFPTIGAVGGILVPAAIYLAININHKEYYNGWAIPTATDIAFSLGVLTLLGSRIPSHLKLFLVMLAVIDDLSTIITISIFYSHDLSLTSLLMALIGTIGLFILNKAKVTKVSPYIFIGVFIWVCMIKSGVHATLTGVIVGLLLPTKAIGEHGLSPATKVEHTLIPWNNYFILPVFAFANAGVPFTGLSFSLLSETLPLGVLLGLVIGKPLGVLLFVYAGAKLKIITLPQEYKLMPFVGVAVLTGIGFTMSLFVGTLAFGEELMVRIRLGVLLGSLISACLGYFILRTYTKPE